MTPPLTRRGAVALLASVSSFAFAPLARANAEAPRIVRIAPIAADIVEVLIQEGEVLSARQTPYVRQPGDVLTEEKDAQGILRAIRLERDGAFVGFVTGLKRDVLTVQDAYRGAPLDVAAARKASAYALVAADGRRLRPTKIAYKAKGVGFSRSARRLPYAHHFYLQFDKPLTIDATYRLQISGLALAGDAADYTHAPERTRSDAVHVNQVGFATNDPVKWAHLSAWIGDGGGVRYPARVRFHLIDEATGARVYSAEAGVYWPASRPDYIVRRDNLTKADIYRLDFSSFSKPGHYRVFVEGVGCSYPFEIGADIWRRVAQTSLQGLYHQRSGIALGPPLTDFVRPRPHHPDDGVVVYKSKATLMGTSMGLGEEDSFAALVAQRTDETVRAFGGYQDAGDWDRRAQHLMVPRLLLELYELAPEALQSLSLRIPEAGGRLPDLVDEALWTLDFFKMLQEEHGGVSGGVEASEHPAPGDTSWTEILPVFAYAPDPWTSYLYAGAAARAAHALKTLAPQKAADYLQSARRAMSWAEGEVARLKPSLSERQRDGIARERNLAAIELYRTTGEAAFHAMYKEDSELAGDASHGQDTATFVYATLPNGLGEPPLKARAKARSIAIGDQTIAFQTKNAYAIAAPSHSVFAAQGFFSGPKSAGGLVRAHALTGDAKYLTAARAASQFGLGANPDNMVFTTGLGANSPRWVLHEDASKTGQPMPAGITVYGIFDYDMPEAADKTNGWFFMGLTFPDVAEKMTPSFLQWPIAETYVDMWNWVCMNEYTVQECIAPCAYVWCYLAAKA